MSSMTDLKTLGLSFTTQAINQLPKITTGIVVFIAFYLAAKLTRWLTIKSLKHAHWDKSVKQLLSKSVEAAITILGLITALGTAGINVSALVCSVGLVSFSIGFAFKDFLTNTLAGVLILLYHPFKPGNFISGKDFEGCVEEINLRYVRLNHDDNTILVPNSIMLTCVVKVLPKTGMTAK